MAEELLSIEMRLTVDRALRDYNEFKDKLKARPIGVKFDLGLNKVLANAQTHFNNYKLHPKLDWSAARSSFVKFTKDFGTIKTKVVVNDSALTKLKRDINEVDRALIDIGVRIDRSGFDAFDQQVKGLADRSVKLSALTDTQGFEAFQTALGALTDRTISISGGSGLGALQQEVKSLLTDLQGLGDRVVNLSVSRSGADELGTLVAELAALQDKQIDLRVDVKGEEVTALDATIAELKSKAALLLRVDVVGDEIQQLLGTIDAIRAQALNLDVQVAGGEFKGLVDALDQMRSEVVQVRFNSDISGLAVAHDRIQDFQEAAHNGIQIPITTDQARLDESVAQLKAIEKLAIQVEVDTGKLAAAVALIQSNLNPEDFVAKLTIDTGDLEGSMLRLREAQRELTNVKKGMEGAFAIQATQDVLTQQIRNVKELQAANEDRMRREAALQRFENTHTMKAFQAWAKELSITPTTGLKKSDYEAMFKSLLEIEDAAELVAQAWKITGQKFDSVTDEMEAKSEHTKNVLWGNLNHGAADLVRFAWDRTSGSFAGNLKDMQQQAERAGKQISDALDAAAKDSTFKLTVNSKQAKKDLADFQNYAKLLIKNDLSYAINTAKAQYDVPALSKQLRALQAEKRMAAKEDKAAIVTQIGLIEDQLAAYKETVRAAQEEARSRRDALEDQSLAYKILIANTEAEEKAQDRVTQSLKRTREEADRLADERAAAAKQRQADDDKAIAAQTEYLRGQQKIADEAAQNRALEARERADFDKKRMGAQAEYLDRLRKEDEARQKIIDAANKQFQAIATVQAKEAEKAADTRKKQAAQDAKDLDSIQRELFKASQADAAKGWQDQVAIQKRAIQDLMTIKDTKQDADGAGGLGIAGVGANLSKVEKLQERLEAVKRTIADLRNEQIRLKIEDNLPEFRAAISKLTKEEIVITAKIKEQIDGDGMRSRLGGALKGIGREFLQAFNIDLQSVVQGAIQGYQAIGGGLINIAKASLAEFAAVEVSAKQTAALIGGTAAQQKATQAELFKVIETTSLSSGNLFSGKDIGKLTLDLKRAGADLNFINSNLGAIATGATAAQQDLSKFGGTTLQFAEKFASLGGTAVDRFKEQQKAVQLTTFALTNAKIGADEFGKSIQYYNPLTKGTEAMKTFTAQTVALARVGIKGSKTGTDLNSVFKELGSTLDGTSKKSAKQRELFDEIAAASKGLDLSTFKNAEGDIQDSGLALGKLVELYVNFEKEVGNSKANARFQELFGVKGLAAVQNAVAVYNKAFKEISDGVAGLDTDSGAKFAANFAKSMEAGFSGGVQRFSNVVDTYKLKIGRALEPIATAGLTIFNTAATRALSLGGGVLGDMLTSVQEKFKALGSNETLMNNLALAFNRIGQAVGGKLLGLVERLVNYLSNDNNVMQLANGISFWIESAITAFTTVTELLVGVGIAGAKVGETLGGAKFTPLDVAGSKRLTDALNLAASLEDKISTADGLYKAQYQDIVRLEGELKLETNQTADAQKRINDLLRSARSEHTATGLELINNRKELDKQQQTVAAINAEANKSQNRGGGFELARIKTFEGALQLWGAALKAWKDMGIGDDLKLIWDQLFAPNLAVQLSVLAGAFTVLGAAVKLVLTPLKGFALLSTVKLEDFGLAAKQTARDFDAWTESLGLGKGVLTDFISQSPEEFFTTLGYAAQQNGKDFSAWASGLQTNASDTGKWLQDRATETTQWFSDQETARVKRNAQAAAERQRNWDAAEANIRSMIATTTGWFGDRWREAQGVFNGILNGMSAAWNQVVNYFQSAWGQAIGYIGQQIGGLLDRARQIPVVGGFVPGFARGGVVYGPPSKTDNVIIAARGGEGVLVPEAVAAMGGAVGLERFNRRAEAGAAGFAAGGVVSPLAQLTVPGGQTTAEYLKSNQVTVKAVSANPPTVNAAIEKTAKAAEKTAGSAAKSAKTAEATTATMLTHERFGRPVLWYLNDVFAALKSISNKISQLATTMTERAATYSSALSAPTAYSYAGMDTAAAAQKPTSTLVGYTGNTGIGTGAHLHIQIKDKSRDLTAAELGRFIVGGKNLANETTTSGYGPRNAPVAGASTFHGGRDYGFADGTPIITNSPVKSRKVWDDPNGGGIVTDIEFEDGLQVRVLHSNAKTRTIGNQGIRNFGNPTNINGTTATNNSVPFSSVGGGGLSQATVNQWMQGGTNSLMAKAIGMAEGNRTSGGAYTKYAYGHTDPGNGAYNIGSFSAQGGLNDGTIAGSDQRVIDRLIKPRVGELFAAAAKAGVIVTPQVLFNYLDLANQAPLAATGDRNGPGFLGQLSKLKGRENDQAAIANLRVESYRLNSGRLDTTFSSQAALLKDQQRRMGELTAAIKAFQIKGDVVTGVAKTQQNITQAQVNFKALTEKLAPADQSLIASVDAGDTAQAATDLKQRLDQMSAERDALIKAAPTPKDPKKATPAEVAANKALQEKVKALDKRRAELQAVLNATYKIDAAETQVQNRKDEAAFSDQMAALNEQARNIAGEKETAKESAKLRDLLRARDEYIREVTFANEKKAADLKQLDLEFKGQLEREMKRKDGNVAGLKERQAGERAQRVRALDEAIKEAQYGLEGQLIKISDYYKSNALDDRADKLAEITALQKRIREQSINGAELDAALKRLGIAQINGQFVVDKALSESLSDISGKVDKAAERSQGQIEKLMRGQGLVFKDALFDALDLEYNYYMQKRDSDLNKATSDQLSFLYGKGLLRTGSFEGGSYIQGAQGNLRDRLGEISLTSEAAIRNKKLDAINALYQAGGIDEAMAKKMALDAGGSVEVIRAGVNPGLKQATGKRLTTLSDVPYTSRAEIQTAIRESQSTVAAPLVAASAPMGSGYMAKATTPMRIKLDIPPGTDERITSVVRQTEAALNSDEYTQRMLGEFMSILRSDPQLARQILY